MTVSKLRACANRSWYSEEVYTLFDLMYDCVFVVNGSCKVMKTYVR